MEEMSKLHFLFLLVSRKKPEKTFSLVQLCTCYSLQLVFALLWQYDVRSSYTVVLKDGGKEIDSEAPPEKITR